MESYKLPISVKGIVFEDNSVWLRKNERDEWELPGGKLDRGEQPSVTVVRELQEELGFEVEPIKIVHAEIYTIKESLEVLILSYLCKLKSKTGNFELIGEAGKAEFQKFSLSEIPNLNLPELYKVAIALG
jgi:8-oxo-dGTP pyrophosphatase MutT (NUDIX family)